MQTEVTQILLGFYLIDQFWMILREASEVIPRTLIIDASIYRFERI
jgi:hypothetical protein